MKQVLIKWLPVIISYNCRPDSPHREHCCTRNLPAVEDGWPHHEAACQMAQCQAPRQRRVRPTGLAARRLSDKVADAMLQRSCSVGSARRPASSSASLASSMVFHAPSFERRIAHSRPAGSWIRAPAAVSRSLRWMRKRSAHRCGFIFTGRTRYPIPRFMRCAPPSRSRSPDMRRSGRPRRRSRSSARSMKACASMKRIGRNTR